MKRILFCAAVAAMAFSMSNAKNEIEAEQPARKKLRVCMDWDDSCFTDYRLVALCRKYGAKATFNIMPDNRLTHCYMQKKTTERNGTTYHFMSKDNFDREHGISIPFLRNDDFADCYKGFKVAAHLNFHTSDSDADLAEAKQLMLRFLEVAPEIDGQREYGIVWSGGRQSPGIRKLAKEMGFTYCRGANSYEKQHPEPEWEIAPTTYWSEPSEQFWAWYEAAKERGDYFWFWGHSQDLGYDDEIWARLEGIIKRISEDPDAEWVDVDDIRPGK